MLLTTQRAEVGGKMVTGGEEVKKPRGQSLDESIIHVDVDA